MISQGIIEFFNTKYAMYGNVKIKNSDCDVSVLLYVLRYSEFIFDIFYCYVSMCMLVRGLYQAQAGRQMRDEFSNGPGRIGKSYISFSKDRFKKRKTNNITGQSGSTK